MKSAIISKEQLCEMIEHYYNTHILREGVSEKVSDITLNYQSGEATIVFQDRGIVEEPLEYPEPEDASTT